MRDPSLFLALAVALAACRPSVDSGPVTCALASPVRRIAVPKSLPGEVHEVYDHDNAADSLGPEPRFALPKGFAEQLRARLGADLSQRTLLTRAHAVLAASPRTAADAANLRAVLTGKAGAIGPASCLEKLLFTKQSRRYPMLDRPTEFGAFVLRRQAALRVYVSSFDRAGGKIRGEVLEAVAADLEQGFTLVAHIHNHNFFLARRVGDESFTTETAREVGGGVAPSATDVQLYRRLRASLGLRAAWVTNGFDTGRYGADDFDRLRAR